MRPIQYVIYLFFMGLLLVNHASHAEQKYQDEQAVAHFLNYFYGDQESQKVTLEFLEENWRLEYTPMALEVMYLSGDAVAVNRMLRLIERKTGNEFGFHFNTWYEWLWKQDLQLPKQYADFKGHLYRTLDPRFSKYFLGRYESEIQLQEIRWGGVKQDGIPPLRDPEMIIATEAKYLEDDNIVFGIEVNGDVRAYPKRILAWHEMFVDEVGGIPVAGVYCTLCGTVILYKTTYKGTEHQMGTSGFLYRSNKLMYDQATQSLWNTVWGTPVLGPLAGKGIELESMSVVTTTWGEWKRRHPETKVLSLQTGYTRNYGEGVAYRDYFATDELMFNTPYQDDRLLNKQEVLALRFEEEPNKPLAISAEFLKKNTVFQSSVGQVKFVVFTDQTGGNRVYEVSNQKFKSYDGDQTIKDKSGESWTLSEDKIVSASGKVLNRLPYRRAFWFGWLASYPDTKLIK